MAWADVSRGVQGAVQAQLMRRMQEQQMQAQAQEHQRRAEMELRSADRADRGQALQEEQYFGNRERQVAQDKIAADTLAFNQGNVAAEQAPGGAFFADDDAYGAKIPSYLKQATPERPAMGEDFAGPMPGGETPQQAQVGRPGGFIKTRTNAQRNAEEDDARAAQVAQAAQAHQGMVDDRGAAAAAETGRHNRAMESKPTSSPRERFNVQPITNQDGTTGLVRINMDTGETTPVALPGGANSGRASDTGRLSAAYLERTAAAHSNVTPFEAKLQSLGPQAGVQLPTLLQSEAGQLYSQGRDEFINAALRRESGAAIQPSEYERFDKIYFVQPGDKPANIKQKQAARQRVIEGFQTAAGNIRSGPGATGGGGGMQRMRAPDGRMLNVPADKVAEMEQHGATRQ